MGYTRCMFSRPRITANSTVATCTTRDLLYRRRRCYSRWRALSRYEHGTIEDIEMDDVPMLSEP